MAKVESYIKSSLKVVVAQICDNMGWHSIQSRPLDVLVDILHRYLAELGETAHRYSENFGRTEPNLDDLGLTFKDIGIELDELKDYVNDVESVPFVQDLPKIPVERQIHLHIPKADCREVSTRPEWIDEHLPLINPEAEDEVGVAACSDFNRKYGVSSLDNNYKTAQEIPRPLEAIGTYGDPDEECTMRQAVSVFLTSTGDIVGVGRQPKFADENRCSSSSHNPKPVEATDARNDGKKELKKMDEVMLKNKKDKLKLIKNGKIEKVKNSSKRNKKKEDKKLKLITDSTLNNVEPGPDGKFKKVVKSSTEKLDKPKRKTQLLNILSQPSSSMPKIAISPEVIKLKPSRTERDLSPLARLDDSTPELGASKSEMSGGFSAEDSLDVNPVLAVNPVMTDAEETAKVCRESSRSYLEAIKDVIETPFKTKRKLIHDFSDDDLSFPTTPKAVATLAASPPKKKPRLEPVMGKKMRSKNKEKNKKKPREPKTKPLFPKFRMEEMEPQDFSRSFEMVPQMPPSPTEVEEEEGEEIDKGKASQKEVEEVVKRKNKKKKDVGSEKSQNKEKKDVGSEKSQNKEKKDVGSEKRQNKSNKGSKETAPKSKKNEKKEDKLKEDPSSTIPRITLKLGENAAQSKGTKIIIKPLALPREVLQSSDSSSTTPKSRSKPETKVNSVPLSEKFAIASTSTPARTVITETIGTRIDECENKIWICPSCTRPDDGSPMIGCDECDDWYHWVCVGIVVPPKEKEDWFCNRCVVKRQGLQKKKKRKHRKL